MSSTHLGRRAFIGGVAAGAVGLGLAETVTAQTSGAKLPPARNMIVRADDVGHSPVCNIGTFEAIDRGVVTSADVMLDSPGTEDALARLKRRPWISVGWHMHMWGAPVLGAKAVPSLVDHGGPFDGRFVTDLATKPGVVLTEAVAELRAQLERCRKILGRVPDTANAGNPQTVWGRAVQQVVDSYNIPYNVASSPPTDPAYIKKLNDAQAAGEAWARYYPTTPSPARQADPRWIDRRIVSAAGPAAYMDLLTDSVGEVERKYDPVLFYTEDRAGILRYPPDVTITQAWHPGYVDYYVYRLGERVNRARAQQFVVGRTQDVAALCDERLKSWIRTNRIRLVNFRDALYGSHEYQSHLQAVGSNLLVT